MTKEFGCCPQTIEESEIETAILTMLKMMAAVVADREILEEARHSSAGKTAETEKLLTKYEKEVGCLANQRLEKYRAYKNELLSREDFIKEKSALEGKIKILLSEIEKCRQKLYDDKCADAREQDVALQLGKYVPFESLTREMVEAFVERVYVCRDGSIRIAWKFKDFSKFF